MSEPRVTDADLSNANLTGARQITRPGFKWAAITDEQLSKVKSLKGATMPDGTKHE
jgi:uncharacterized protein YjbI with pentapeptide repeats